jgi:type VI secretion system lysozyme-like protein
LFDRLVDEEPLERRELTPKRTLDWIGVRSSIARELHRIVSTRAPVDAETALDRELTVTEFGIPELDSRSGDRLAGNAKVERLLVRAIEAFEPRLKNVDVRVVERSGVSVSGSGLRATALVSGTVVLDDLREPMSFSMPLGEGGEGG